MPFTFACPGCFQVMTVPDEAAGRKGTCPKCRHQFRIPATQPAPLHQDPPPPAPAPAADAYSTHAPPGNDADHSHFAIETPRRAKSGFPTVNLLQAAVWLAVTLWCFAPVVWFFIMLMSSLFEARPQAPQPGFNPGPMPRGNLLMQIGSSVAMMVAFMYGSWCAVGVLMGLGMDRAIASTAPLLSHWFGRRS